ncbi:MAG: ATP-binding cassette domain-containing protein [Alphaproteobacteria bacterium]|nr:ATP-binding cassette domain-containing protein [Alphaproteobacteria bacterium]
MSGGQILLQVSNLTMRFGGLVAVDRVSFNALENSITAVIGPNGAGKTTLFNCLTGFYRPTSGNLTLRPPGGDAGRNTAIALEKMPPHEITARAGIARTFQNIRLFASMTALENLLVAQHTVLMRASPLSFGALLNFPKFRKSEERAIEKARFWLEQMDLLPHANRPAGELPYGAQRRLEIARAMCTDPCLLCLDEPAAGLNPSESAALGKLLVRICREQKIGVLLIEHDMSVVMGISNHIVVLDYGRKIAEGAPEDIRSNPAVIQAYLGEDTTEGDGAVA